MSIFGNKKMAFIISCFSFFVGETSFLSGKVRSMDSSLISKNQEKVTKEFDGKGKELLIKEVNERKNKLLTVFETCSNYGTTMEKIKELNKECKILEKESKECGNKELFDNVSKRMDLINKEKDKCVLDLVDKAQMPKVLDESRRLKIIIDNFEDLMQMASASSGVTTGKTKGMIDDINENFLKVLHAILYGNCSKIDDSTYIVEIGNKTWLVKVDSKNVFEVSCYTTSKNICLYKIVLW